MAKTSVSHEATMHAVVEMQVKLDIGDAGHESTSENRREAEGPKEVFEETPMH